ncbi:DUF1905 domain-containing protein [Mucilaginibacter sp. RS28]|uniref:DUF1905 domain-containing protein n=1 Tax=Mucilaginibacter straminoryzae TaxID=2932774 RepID=A0A9X2B746_9SPHI|nr:DUF1905 domain-containing protein [Mucilaginibacter straminoryzae]MCJ8208124.1 DUF1905 domain-containing protein [Mucilaginibacter straminoryzae]
MIRYEFVASLWQYPGPNSWYFVSLPKILSKEIRTTLRSEEEGWGRLKAIAKVGGSEWKTAIWFDTKTGTYSLPLKSEIRKKEALQTGQEVSITLWI